MKHAYIPNIYLRSLILVFLFLAYGCSSISTNSVLQGHTHNFPYSMKEINDSYWWRCRFKVVWPEDTEPDMSVDLLLAHSVVSPTLSKYAQDIPYWRFHRRAMPDNGGHQFSFIFYSNPETAASVFNEIDNNKILKDCVKSNIVEQVLLDDPKAPQDPYIEDTSDDNWSPEVMRNWPSYIMGASSFWLGLIADYKSESSNNSTNAKELLQEYREIDEKITELWSEEGGHALLHHLYAVFGYNPLLMRF